MLQKLKLKDGTEITFKQGNYDVEKKEIELSIPYTKSNNRFVEQIRNGFDLYKEDISIQFEWNNQQFNAYLFSGVVKSLEKEGDEWVHYVIFQVCDVKCKEDIPDECRLLFFIPNVKFHMCLGTPRRNASFGGKTDRTPFVYNNRQWQFREAYNVSDSKKLPYPYDLIETKNEQQVGIFLETIKTSSEDIDAIEGDAKEICTLASLAQGCHSCWQTLWYIQNGEIKLCYYSNLATNDHNNSKPAIVLNKYNCSNPCEFIQNAETEYKQNPEWWRLTIVWYVNGRNSDAIETNKIIEGMLFDRITNKFFSIIAEALGKKLEKIKSQNDFYKKIAMPLLNKIITISNTLQLSNEDQAFIDMCKQWENNNYITRIRLMLGYIGIQLDDKDVKELKNRNSLVHNGTFEYISSTELDYDSRISKYCLLSLLPMLCYGEIFNTRTEQFKVKNEAKYWERLKLSSIEEKAQRLLK